jgi:hypothetical protein
MPQNLITTVTLSPRIFCVGMAKRKLEKTRSHEATRNSIRIPNTPSVSITTILNQITQSQSINIQKNAIKLNNCGNPKPQDSVGMC